MNFGFDVDWLGGFDGGDCVELTWIHFHAGCLRLAIPWTKLKRVAVGSCTKLELALPISCPIATRGNGHGK